MFPSFNKEKSNYLPCWKNVCKGKVNLEGGNYIYIKIIQILSPQPGSVGSPAVLALWIGFVYEQGEYFPVTRLLAGFATPAAVEDCPFLPPWLWSAGYIKGWSSGYACGHVVRVCGASGRAGRIWGAGVVSTAVCAAVWLCLM